MKLQRQRLFAILILAIYFLPATLLCAAEKKGTDIKLADGKVSMKAPQDWVSKKPAFKIIQYEFTIPAAGGDETNGRLTIMGAGGSVKINIDRWMTQFSQADGKSTKERTTIDELKIAGQKVHVVDITGDFKTRRGVVGKEYRMLGAIIVTDKLGQYFLKMIGPKRTIAAHEKKFKEVLNSLRVK